MYLVHAIYAVAARCASAKIWRRVRNSSTDTILTEKMNDLYRYTPHPNGNQSAPRLLLVTNSSLLASVRFGGKLA